MFKTSIQQHYSAYESIKRTYERQENIHRKYLADYFMYDIEYSLLKKGMSPFKNEKVLYNILQSKLGGYMLQITASNKGIEDCNTMLNTLQQQLD